MLKRSIYRGKKIATRRVIVSTRENSAQNLWNFGAKRCKNRRECFAVLFATGPGTAWPPASLLCMQLNAEQIESIFLLHAVAGYHHELCSSNQSILHI
jgi:hypothetical protein